MSAYPELSTIHETATRLHGKVLQTPVWQWQTGIVAEQLLPQTEVWLKLEMLQKTGTFKLRGALNCIEALDAEAKARGVVAVSAGNHAIAVAYASAVAGTHAKVVMLEKSSPARIAACKASGAEILLAPDIHQAFAWAKQIAEDESRTMIHPFEGPLTALGTATVGLELMQQVPQLDAVLVPIGGGGLCAGIAAAVKQINPACAVYGIEPEGANSMSRSLQAGQPEKLESVSTVADSLGAPFALPYSFGVCQRFVDEVVTVSDDELCRAMYYLFRDMKLVTEPATAASTAALLGPLKARLNGKKVGLIVCGANIDAGRYSELLARGQTLTDATTNTD